MIEKIFKLAPSKSKFKLPTNVCKIFFDNKEVDVINLPRVLYDQSILTTPSYNVEKTLYLL